MANGRYSIATDAVDGENFRQHSSEVRPRKMQKARCLCASFFLILIVLLGNWLVTDVNAQQYSCGPLPPKQTRRTATGRIITYRLDAWSQYNNPEEGLKREGDINNNLPSRKAVASNKALLWPNGVVNYYVNPIIVNQPKKLAVLENALHTIMSKTCIKFVRIQEYEKIPPNNWVNISGHYMGCFSDIGCRRRGPTIMNLDVNQCLYELGHSIHEMMHALGVYHEHMRPDRNQYIEVIWENIKKSHAYNFNLLNNSHVTTYGLPYDYDSIMHYSMTSFAIDKRMPTLIPKNSRATIGQRNHMSRYDVQKLLITYNCMNKMNNRMYTKNSYNNEKLTRRNSLIQTDNFDHLKLQQNNLVLKTGVELEVPIFTIDNSKSNELENNNYDQEDQLADLVE